MLKLYKEYPDSAFEVWQQQQVCRRQHCSNHDAVIGFLLAAAC
jgi:hypothetical protein